MSAKNGMIKVQKAARRKHRAKFLPEEDEKLKSLVSQYGDGNWDVIAKNMKGRNTRQCRERWKHYLSGGGSESQCWAEEEDRTLISKVKELGPKWTKIATFLPGRTDIQAKARWIRLSESREQSVQKALEIVSPDATKQLYPNSSQNEHITSTIFDGDMSDIENLDSDWTKGFLDDSTEFKSMWDDFV